MEKRRNVIINYRITSKKGGFPPLFRDQVVILVKEKRLVKLHRRTYVFMSIIIHPDTKDPCLIPMHSYDDVHIVDGVQCRKLYVTQQETDHNPDIHGLTGKKE